MSNLQKDTIDSTISFVVQASKVTKEVLKELMRDFLKNSKPHGQKRYGTIAKQGKLESIEITQNNIGDFLKTAKKYDIDYALKRDSQTEPPTYHIFFTAASADTFKRAFNEYVSDVSSRIKSPVTREQLKENAKVIDQKYAEQAKARHLSKTEITGR